ncbi:MAG: N-acetylmuramoyl-L-alanine amidase [Paludibacteraceae bacterium]|nr:N-acetylmuramoyl-L-alanine amidase [Paludibacteraceae bacterium]
MKKHIFSTLLLLLLLWVSAMPLHAYTVVIDAGHGGKDPGALGKITREKDLTLAVSKQLYRLFQDSMPEVDAYLTRSTDVFLTLQERADFVNKHNADFFICIHANAAENKKLYGAETYVLGLHKMESNLQVAMRENAVMMLEDDYKTAYQGFDPNSVESYIMFEFMQDRYLDNSLQFASLVQQQFAGTLGRADRGVRQAGFWVLHKSACPSVLIEMGFVSHPEEEKYLASAQGKQQITRAIFDAFRQYKQSLDRKAAALSGPAENKPQAAASKPQPASAKADTVQHPAPAPASQVSSAQSAPALQAFPPQSAPAAQQPVFRVQIFSVKSPLKPSDPSFRGLKGCTYVKDGGWCKYSYGEETDYQKALALKKQLEPKFKDCFLVAFLDGRQIPVKQALRLISQ